jgi:hypothetical protein
MKRRTFITLVASHARHFPVLESPTGSVLTTATIASPQLTYPEHLTVSRFS